MKELRKYVWVVLTALAFGTMEIALHIGGNAFTALQLTFLRFLIGGLCLLPFALRDLRRRGAHLSRKDWGFICLLAFVNIVVSMTLFQLSVMHSNANLAAVLISLNPLFTMVFARFVAGERFTRRKALVLAICITGLVLVATPWELAQGNTAAGLVMGLGAAVFFGLYTALSRRVVPRIGGMALNSFSFLIGAFLELGVLAAWGDPVFGNVTAESLPILAYTGFVVTGFGYFCFMRAIERCGASSASYAFFIKPVIAMLLAAAILGEAITWNIVLGIAIIVAGCFFNVLRRPSEGGGNKVG